MLINPQYRKLVEGFHCLRLPLLQYPSLAYFTNILKSTSSINFILNSFAQKKLFGHLAIWPFGHFLDHFLAFRPSFGFFHISKKITSFYPILAKYLQNPKHFMKFLHLIYIFLAFKIQFPEI